jgi:hypothetical protein
MFPLPKVFYLFPDKLPSLSARGSPFTGFCFRALDRLLFWHGFPLSFLAAGISLRSGCDSVPAKE